jgi:hypothetical protein
MLRLAPLLLVACIVPHKTHTTRRIAHVVGPQLPTPTELTVRVADGTIHVTALRVCRAHAHDLVADTTHVTADLVGASTMPRRSPLDPPDREMEAGNAFELVVLAVSGIATAVDIAVEDGRVTTRRERAPDDSLPCPMALRDVPIEVELPSGRVLEGTTDDTGSMELALPDGEQGQLVVRAPGVDPEIAFVK